jgi:predicted phosphoribosyltransferase
MRYFKDRTTAGKLLAEQMKIHDYQTRNCAVVALSEGGIMIGAEIAKAIHSSLFLLTIEDITLPRELEPLASMSSAGTFTFNHSLSTADLEEISTESRTLIDQMRLDTFKKLNRVVSKDGEVDRKLLHNHLVILVSDGIQNGLSLDVAADFLKPILSSGIVVATPICNTTAVDRIRLMAESFYCLAVIEQGFPLNHYYEDNSMPDHNEVVDLMKNISLSW